MNSSSFLKHSKFSWYWFADGFAFDSSVRFSSFSSLVPSDGAALVPAIACWVSIEEKVVESSPWSCVSSSGDRWLSLLSPHEPSCSLSMWSSEVSFLQF